MLSHDFKIINQEKIIQIDDDIILYILDTLLWIKTYSDKELLKIKNGIQYYGYTYFDKEGIQNLKTIIVNWRNLFENAPSYFALKIYYSLETNNFEKTYYLKKKVLSQFDDLINLCEGAVKENQILVHMGI